jgi:hypothetical protein
MAAYYKHSGRFTPQGPILGLLMGVAVSVPAAFLYDYGIVAIPEAKLRGICTLVFGGLIGALAGLGMCWGKVRNGAVAATVGFVSSALGLYLSWDAWVLHLVHPDRWLFNLTRPATHPHRLWQAMLAINQVGTWSFGSGSKPDHGVFLWLVWGAEALLVVGIGTLAALALVQIRPFCERCDQWCKQKSQLYFAPNFPGTQLKSQLESQDIAGLENLTAGDKKQPHFRIDLHTCGNCHSLNTVTLHQNLPKNSRTLMNKLLVTPDQAAIIRNLALAHSSGARSVPVPATSK